MNNQKVKSIERTMGYVVGAIAFFSAGLLAASSDWMAYLGVIYFVVCGIVILGFTLE